MNVIVGLALAVAFVFLGGGGYYLIFVSTYYCLYVFIVSVC